MTIDRMVEKVQVAPEVCPVCDEKRARPGCVHPVRCGQCGEPVCVDNPCCGRPVEQGDAEVQAHQCPRCEGLGRVTTDSALGMTGRCRLCDGEGEIEQGDTK